MSDERITEEQLAEWERVAKVPGCVLRDSTALALIAEVRRLRDDAAAYATVCSAIGIEYAPDTGPTYPGPVEAVVAAIKELRAEVQSHALENAPAPREYHDKYDESEDCHHCLDATAKAVWHDKEQIRMQLAAVTRERDAMRAVVEQIAEGEGCYTHGYATNCDMECQAKARAALAKLDEASK